MSELSWKIGDVVITRVAESSSPVPPSGLLPGATAEGIQRHRSWLAPYFLDDNDQFILSIHGLVIEADGLRILVDTCIGSRPTPGYEMMSGRHSPFLDNLATAGFPLESIDVVLCTHLHFDHVGWNTRLVDGRWVPTFPNARYLFGRKEWEHWSTEGPGGYAVTIDDAVRPLIEGGQADLVETDHRVCASVWLEATPGHTPGHVAVRVASGGQEALITGDLTHHPVQWAEPEWCAAPDTDLAQSAATRRRLISEHGDRETLVIGTHYAPPCAGHIVTIGGATQFKADG
ncbi:MAG TPA: MBL fold metallo-hydrolase [Acidimicrobiales bacterium]|jgi:glyoxylase-like metal-dependent hydrolase (beta-lactamase superfamily II)